MESNPANQKDKWEDHWRKGRVEFNKFDVNKCTINSPSIIRIKETVYSIVFPMNKCSEMKIMRIEVSLFKPFGFGLFSPKYLLISSKHV